MTTKQLHFKWTISRGRDTYGYNICTLLVDGEKVAKTTGGGYDMQGTALGEWIQNNFKSKLEERFKKEIESVNDQDYADRNGYLYKEITSFYGARLSGKKGEPVKVVLDGGCGLDCMKRIAESIGVTFKWNPESNKYKNHTYYTAIINLL